MKSPSIPDWWVMDDPPEAFEGVPDPEPLSPEETLAAETAEYKFNWGLW